MGIMITIAKELEDPKLTEREYHRGRDRGIEREGEVSAMNREEMRGKCEYC